MENAGARESKQGIGAHGSDRHSVGGTDRAAPGRGDRTAPQGPDAMHVPSRRSADSPASPAGSAVRTWRPWDWSGSRPAGVVERGSTLCLGDPSCPVRGQVRSAPPGRRRGGQPELLEQPLAAAGVGPDKRPVYHLVIAAKKDAETGEMVDWHLSDEAWRDLAATYLGRPADGSPAAPTPPPSSPARPGRRTRRPGSTSGLRRRRPSCRAGPVAYR